jgi:hypothetical protein
MKKSLIHVGLDVYKDSLVVAMATGRQAAMVLQRIRSDWRQFLKVLGDLGTMERLRVCCEAGPAGHELARRLNAIGVYCIVVAPALIPARRKSVPREIVAIAEKAERRLSRRFQRLAQRANRRRRWRRPWRENWRDSCGRSARRWRRRRRRAQCWRRNQGSQTSPPGLHLRPSSLCVPKRRRFTERKNRKGNRRGVAKLDLMGKSRVILVQVLSKRPVPTHVLRARQPPTDSLPVGNQPTNIRLIHHRAAHSPRLPATLRTHDSINNHNTALA